AQERAVALRLEVRLGDEARRVLALEAVLEERARVRLPDAARLARDADAAAGADAAVAPESARGELLLRGDAEVAAGESLLAGERLVVGASLRTRLLGNPQAPLAAEVQFLLNGVCLVDLGDDLLHKRVVGTVVQKAHELRFSVVAELLADRTRRREAATRELLRLRVTAGRLHLPVAGRAFRLRELVDESGVTAVQRLESGFEEVRRDPRQAVRRLADLP